MADYDPVRQPPRRHSQPTSNNRTKPRGRVATPTLEETDSDADSSDSFNPYD